MKSFLKRATAILVVVILVLMTGFVFWASDVAFANEVAVEALIPDSQVFVNAENGVLIFYPANTTRPETGFIFYPGGKVDYRAYAPILKMIASNGYFVVVTPAPLNIAMFDINAAARIQAQYPEIKNWFVGGHSLGGAAASSYAGDHPDIKGVVLWASNPVDDALKIKNIPTLLIYGTQDGLISGQMMNDSLELLPMTSRLVSIEGGNHAQFGSYGFQSGDNEASISAKEQWSQAVSATVEFFVEVLE